MADGNRNATQGAGDDRLRLSKVVAARVPCSRSEAERYITEGWVRVDGTRVEEPQFRVSPQQRVEVDPGARLQPTLSATLLLHQPAGLQAHEAQALLKAGQRWPGDTSGIHHLRSHLAGLRALLPLPPGAGGLAVFSQDRRIVRRLEEDGALIEQELLAEVAGTPSPDGLARLAHGLSFEGQPLPPAHVSWQSETRLRIAAKGLPPAHVPWMCEQVGLQLRSLRRIRVGRISMGALPPGQWRYLRPGERF